MGPSPSTPAVETDASSQEPRRARLRFGSPEAIRFSTALVLTVLFLGLLCTPTLDWVFHLDHTPVSDEKRLLASFPSYAGLKHMHGFLGGLNLYFDDHFGFRRRLVRANNHWKRQLFRTPPSPDVLIGRDGWLYFTTCKMLDHYTGIERFTQADLEAWQKLLEKRHDWLAHRGCRFLFVVAPDKHSIYPEHLPDWLVRSDKPSKLDQFLTHMKAHSTVRVVDLRQALLAGKSQAPVYLKTDTHWNRLGAFLAYEVLARALGQELPGFKPLPLTAFSHKQFQSRAGDLAEMLGDTGSVETQEFTFKPLPPLQPIDAVPAPDILPKHWNKEVAPTMARNPAGVGKVVVFQDSFARYWRPLLAQHFREMIYIPEHVFERELLEHEKPDVVINEMVERNFNILDPRELLTQDRLTGKQESAAR